MVYSVLQKNNYYRKWYFYLKKVSSNEKLTYFKLISITLNIIRFLYFTTCCMHRGVVITSLDLNLPPRQTSEIFKIIIVPRYRKSI